MSAPAKAPARGAVWRAGATFSISASAKARTTATSRGSSLAKRGDVLVEFPERALQRQRGVVGQHLVDPADLDRHRAGRRGQQEGGGIGEGVEHRQRLGGQQFGELGRPGCRQPAFEVLLLQPGEPGQPGGRLAHRQRDRERPAQRLRRRSPAPARSARRRRPRPRSGRADAPRRAARSSGSRGRAWSSGTAAARRCPGERSAATGSALAVPSRGAWSKPVSSASAAG